jgi:hypothetical protein
MKPLVCLSCCFLKLWGLAYFTANKCSEDVCRSILFATLIIPSLPEMRFIENSHLQNHIMLHKDKHFWITFLIDASILYALKQIINADCLFRLFFKRCDQWPTSNALFLILHTLLVRTLFYRANHITVIHTHMHTYRNMPSTQNVVYNCYKLPTIQYLDTKTCFSLKTATFMLQYMCSNTGVSKLWPAGEHHRGPDMPGIRPTIVYFDYIVKFTMQVNHTK